MSLISSSFVGRFGLVALLAVSGVSALRADTFTKPTKEELEMKSVPGFPNAQAMVLFSEEITTDDLHVTQFYKRIKILNEAGKELANVELPFYNMRGYVDLGKDQFGHDMAGEGDDQKMGDIVGRTIHADGTIIPFTGKPYLKTIQKTGGMSRQALVFTLPDVEVGSIIEYRYAKRSDDNGYSAPDWYIQGPLYVKEAHYVWYPTKETLMGPSGGLLTSITWFPVLPAGVKVEHRELANGGFGSRTPPQIYEVRIKDVPPAPVEEFMPPVKSLTYRVMFNFSEYGAPDAFWKAEGKEMFKKIDGFASPNDAVRKVARETTAGATTDEEKLHKIYALVQTFENTDYTREHHEQEDKAAGLKKVSGAADVIERKRGSSQQITEAFLSLVRAAGMKAYAMWVPDRSSHLFMPQWLNAYGQFDELIVIVPVGSNEVFFDPGERYTPYGHLAWQHTFVGGIREVDGGTKLDQAVGDGYKENRTTRVANVKLDESGQATGTLVVTYYGASALAWRQRALRGDDQSLKRGLRISMERMLPRTLQVRVQGVQNVADYEKPLAVTYDVKGTIGSATGKRLVLPSDLFTANEVAMFPHEKRELPVYFHYPQQVVDAQRIFLPATMSVEGTPEAAKTMFQKSAAYDLSVTAAPNSVTTRRSLTFGEVLMTKEEYPELRKFYGGLQSKDKEPVVLKATATLELPSASAKPKDEAPDADDNGDEDDDSADSGN